MSQGENIDALWKGFMSERTRDLFHRFPGWYRAVVVDTNDPLQMHRIRFKIPELHDEDIEPESATWAIPAPTFGGKGSGEWASVVIGDEVWVTFEKGHPYGPIYVAGADPTRRGFYPLESVYTKSPITVKEDGTPDEVPDDYLEEYLPKDNRPMSRGLRDRYGSFIILNSVGYFPVEHAEQPTITGQDAVANSAFQSSQEIPEKNKPDRKMMVMHSKYGHTFMMSDVGYDGKASLRAISRKTKNLNGNAPNILLDFSTKTSRKKRINVELKSVLVMAINSNFAMLAGRKLGKRSMRTVLRP